MNHEKPLTPDDHRNVITHAMLRCCRAYGTTASPGAIAGFESALNDLLRLHRACLAHNEMLAAILQMNLPSLGKQAGQPVIQALNPSTLSIVRDDGGERPVFCVMAAYRTLNEAESHGCHGGDGATFPAEPVKLPSDDEIDAVFQSHDAMPGLTQKKARSIARALLAKHGRPSLPYNLDTDPAGVRALAADAIRGAIGFGAQGVNPPPEGHWLTEFWEAGMYARNGDKES